MDWLGPLGFEEIWYAGRFAYRLGGRLFYFNNYQDFQRSMGWKVTDDTIKSIPQLISKISPLPEGDWYFRGQRDAVWELRAALFRNMGDDDLAKRLELERLILQRIKALLAPILPFRPSSDLEWFMLAQHHGAPTRLLDWSRQALTALFFAVDENQDDRDATFTCLRHDRRPAYNLSIDEMQQAEQIEIALPSSVSDRITHQDSVFTVESNVTGKGGWKDGDVRVFRLNAKYIPRIRRQLSMLGITRENLFPGLESAISRACRDATAMLAFPNGSEA
jgi:type I restriction enzyme M protein